MRPLCFVDTETTSLRPDRQAWEIGLVHVESDGTLRDIKMMVDVDLTNADPKSLHIGDFYGRHPRGRFLSGQDVALHRGELTSARHAAEAVARWTHGTKFIGLNPYFDAEVLTNLLLGQGIIPAWHYHLADIGSAALGWLAAQSRAPQGKFTSDELSRLCGVEPPSAEGRHTALGDAFWVMEWWVAIGMPYPGDVGDG